MRSVRASIRRYLLQDPQLWDTGLSPEGARRALDEAVAGLDKFPRVDETPHKRLLIWCAGNVFTAALPWVALFTRLGSEVTLKAPMSNPQPTVALAECFGLRVEVLTHRAAFALLEEADALLAFGSDAAMAELDRRAEHLPRSLHGHRTSFAILQGGGAALAEAVALDAALYDGRGCMSPAAVFHVGDTEDFAYELAEAMERMEARLPRGDFPPSLGPRWRRRLGLARVEGMAVEGERWGVAVLPVRRASETVLPRLVELHPVDRLEDLHFLTRWPVSTCATNLSSLPFSFPRVCEPGWMQRPAISRIHDGVDVVERLCR